MAAAAASTAAELWVDLELQAYRSGAHTVRGETAVTRYAAKNWATVRAQGAVSDDTLQQWHAAVNGLPSAAQAQLPNGAPENEEGKSEDDFIAEIEQYFAWRYSAYEAREARRTLVDLFSTLVNGLKESNIKAAGVTRVARYLNDRYSGLDNTDTTTMPEADDGWKEWRASWVEMQQLATEAYDEPRITDTVAWRAYIAVQEDFRRALGTHGDQLKRLIESMTLDPRGEDLNLLRALSVHWKTKSKTMDRHAKVLRDSEDLNTSVAGLVGVVQAHPAWETPSTLGVVSFEECKLVYTQLKDQASALLPLLQEMIDERKGKDVNMLKENVITLHATLQDCQDVVRKSTNSVTYLMKVQATSNANRLLRGDPSMPWEAVAPAGQGQYGTVHIWLKRNRHGETVDRVAIKDTVSGNFNQRAAWQPRAALGQAEMPLEVAALYKLRNLRDNEGIMQIRNWRPKKEKSQGIPSLPMFRLYSEYCQFGDLGQFNRIKNDGTHTRYSALQTPRTPDSWIPEPFLWAVLEALTTAGLLLERGDVQNNGGRTWDIIVHGDLKDTNVFLAENNTSKFRGYPLPKIGDFGLAFIVPTAGINPPGNWKGFSGVKYGAPEQTPGIPKLGGNSYHPSSPANVWGVGFVLRQLIHPVPYVSNWNHTTGTDPFSPPAFPPEVRNHYSKRLMDLLEQCMKIDPLERPTFDDIRNLIREDSDHAGKKLSVELLHAPADDPRWQQNAIDFMAPSYPLALSRDIELDQNIGGTTAMEIG